MSQSCPPAPNDLHPTGIVGVSAEASTAVHDPIIDEVRATRDTYAQSFGYDPSAIVADLRAREAKHPELVVSLATDSTNK